MMSLKHHTFNTRVMAIADNHPHVCLIASCLQLWNQSQFFAGYDNCSTRCIHQGAYEDSHKTCNDLTMLCKEGRRDEGMDVPDLTSQENIQADSKAYIRLLQGWADMKSLAGGRSVHAHMIKAGFEPDIFLQNNVVNMYVKCGSLLDARHVFDRMTERDVVSWTAVIAGYAQHDRGEDAQRLFCRMIMADVKPNQFCFASVLRACAGVAALQGGKQVHVYVIKTGFELDTFVGGALIDMYSKCGSLENARQVFDGMPARNVVSWTSMISAYVQKGYGEEALKLYCELQSGGRKVEHFILASVLRASASIPALEQGKQVHAHIIKTEFESDVFVGTALVDMYAKCGSIRDAIKQFHKMDKRNLISFNAMIAGYAQHGHCEEAVKLFIQMKRGAAKFDLFTFASVLSACAIVSALGTGNQVHTQIIKAGIDSTVSVGNALVDMYAKSGRMEHALKVFRKMPTRDLISWTAMITGYAQYGQGERALQLFHQMQELGMKVDQFTLASVLRACASLAALEQGKGVHAHMNKTGFELDPLAGSALVDMYAKCGNIEDARSMFDKISERNIVSWNAMLAGYAQHGCGKETLQLYEHMCLAGIKPNHITLIIVLYACSHVGLVDEGHQYFISITQNHGITPRMEHYACMVDLLGRAGQLDAAENFINGMPFEPGAIVWRTLLGACRIHGNIELGKRAAEHVLRLEPHDVASYVLLANIYAAAGRWGDVAEVRQMMKNNKVKKEPGRSWIEVKNKVHAFVVGDRSHPQTEEIYAKLEALSQKMEEAGYVPDTIYVLHDFGVRGEGTLSLLSQ